MTEAETKEKIIPIIFFSYYILTAYYIQAIIHPKLKSNLDYQMNVSLWNSML